jgi:hypothetical protein
MAAAATTSAAAWSTAHTQPLQSLAPAIMILSLRHKRVIKSQLRKTHNASHTFGRSQELERRWNGAGTALGNKPVKRSLVDCMTTSGTSD